MTEERCLRNCLKRQTTSGNVFFTIWILFGVVGMIGTPIGIISEIVKDPKMMVSMIIAGIIAEVMQYLFFFRFGLFLKTMLNAELNALNKKQLYVCVVEAVAKESHVRHTREHGTDYYIRVNYLKDNQIVQDKVHTSFVQYDVVCPGDKVLLTCHHPSFEAEYMSAFVIDMLMAHFDS